MNHQNVSPDNLFLSFRARSIFMPNTGGIPASLLIYPFIPFIFASIARYPSIIPVLIGAIFFPIYAGFQTEKHNSPGFKTILLGSVFLSPFFLETLFQKPVEIVFFLFLGLSFFYTLQYQEKRLIYAVFLSGIMLGLCSSVRLETWGIIPAFLVFVLFFLNDHDLKKTGSLMLANSFPIIFFTGIILFINWVYSGKASFFLQNSPYSSQYFGLHLPLPRWSLFELRDWTTHAWIGMTPLLWTMFQDISRCYLGLVLILIAFGMEGNINLPASLSLLTIAPLILWPSQSSSWRRFVLIILAVFSLTISWWTIIHQPTRWFATAFPARDQESVPTKVSEYHLIPQFLTQERPVLSVTDPDYYFTASWNDFSFIITPEDHRFPLYVSQPAWYCDFILAEKKNEPGNLSGFAPKWTGHFIVLYQSFAPHPQILPTIK
ncbi:MAG: hypothetical protein NTX88_07805 [Candidatus Atribacteria bacterium]|nr:hypothetical protein [Candidatus Atribacteria bacterium]